MKREIYAVIVLILLSIFFHLLADEQSPGTTFIDKILFNELKVSDKLSLLSKEYYQINEKDITRLMEYLRTCDKDLFIPISNLIFRNKEYIANANEVYDLMLKRRKELVSKPEDVLTFISYLNELLALHRSSLIPKKQFSDLSDTLLLKDCERLTDALLLLIHQMPSEKQEETINVIFSNNANKEFLVLLQLLQMTNGERIIKNLQKSIESGTENEIKLSLLIMNKMDLSNYYSDETFLSKMASLTLHSNSGISNLSNEILERCTGVKGGNNFDWNNWLSKNTLSIRGDIAVTKLRDTNLSIDERINTLDLICSANYGKWSETNDALIAIITIIDDDSAPFQLRSELLGRLVYIASVDVASAPGKHSEVRNYILNFIRKLFYRALEKQDEKLLEIMITVVYASKLINTDSKIRNELYKILANDSYKRHTQLLAASRLSRINFHRKEAAQKLLGFYERCKMYNFEESNEELIQMLLALQEITGKPAQNNKTLKFFRTIEYWRKAVSEMPDDPPEEGKELPEPTNY